MSYTNAFAAECYEFFKAMRETIKINGMNGKHYNAITEKLNEIPVGCDVELSEVRAMGLSLIQRQRVM